MAQISINLLPAQFTKERLKDIKFYKIQAIGVGLILLTIFFSSLVVALRILQSQRIKQVEGNLATAQQKVGLFKDKQVALMALKNRLAYIDQYMGTSSVQAGLLNLLNAILPPTLAVNSLVIDRSGEVALSAIIQDSSTLDQIITDLTNKDKNQNKISKVSIDSLNRSRDGVYRVNLKIKPKE